MSRIRSSMVLLGICVIALLIGVLRLVTERPTLPTGSSYSTDPSGAQGLYEWFGAVGISASRLSEAVVSDESPPASLLVLQPESAIDPTARQAYDTVAEHGGTVIVAGDSLPWVIYARSLGVTVEPIRPTSSLTDGVNAVARYRLRGDNLTPLLMTSDGDWIAASKPYKHGGLIVLATPDPLLNHGLRNDDTSRWVFRNVLHGATSVAVDEAHHSYIPPTADVPMSFDRLLLTSAAGRAVLYACCVVFVFIVLTGRRLGPAIGGRGPTETRRTMYEHVQMLANLYRRAGQFSLVRAAFARTVSRDVARSTVSSDALMRIEGARNESELIAAVREL